MAYGYFAKTVERFPEADELAEDMRAAGFSDVRYRRFTFGIAALHSGTRVAG